MKRVILSAAAVTLLFFSVISCDLLSPGLGNKVDIDAPLVFVSSHPNGAYTHGLVVLSGNFEEDMQAARIQVSFDAGATYVDATIDQDAETWSYDWDTTSIPDGEYNLIFLITDSSGKMTNRNLLVYVDNTGPLVLLSTPSIPGATYYGSAFVLRGEAADLFGVNSVVVEIYNDAETVLLATPSVSGASTWSCVFDSAALVATTGTLKFRITATDKAGNVSTRFYHYYNILVANGYENIVIDDIYRVLNGDLADAEVETYLAANDGTAMIGLYFDQDQNKPTIEVYNPDGTGAANNIFTATSRLSGKAIDSDGVAANSVEIRITTNEATPVEVIPWTSTNNPAGPSVSWSYIMDGQPPTGHMADGEYLIEVRASDIGANQRTTAPYAFTVDSGVPTLVVNTPTQGQYLNGNFTVSGTASDAQGISLVEVSTNNGVDYYPATGTTSWSYDVISPPDGSMLIKVRATEGGGGTKQTTYNLQVIIDRTNPSISFVNPAQSTTVNGQVIFKGTSSDNTQITLVELKIGANDPFIPLSGTYNWEYTVDSTSYANATHAVETPPASDVWKLTVQARATDVANNVTTLTTYYVYIDNDLDKPQVTIIAPSNGQNIGGPVLISGTAFDDDAVDHVEIQIDINGDGDFSDQIDIGDGVSKTLDTDTSDRFEDETQWYTLTGTTVWTEMINSYGELYARADTIPALNGNITIRVRAVDINAIPVTGNYQQITFHCDDTIPRIENLLHEPVPPAVVGVPIQAYDYVSGTFSFTGDVYDDEEVDSIWISYNGGVDYIDITGDASKVTYVDVDHYTLDISIDSTVYIPVSGLFQLRLKVIDNAYYQTISYLTLNVDNQFPTAAYTGTGYNDIFGSDTNSRLQGMAWDTGVVSGIDKIEVYFTRGTGPYTLYSPNGAGTTTATLNDFDDGNGDVPYMDPGEKTDYVITIDKTTELGNDGSGNGDGDGYDESLTLSGSDYNWWAQFDSSNIPDGPLTIHYVTFDKGGNGRHNEQTGFIKNNKPQITGLTVGTDLDFDDSTDDANERFVYDDAYGITGRNLLYISVTATDNDTLSDYRVYHPDAAGALVLSAAAGDIDISGYSEGPTTFLIRVTDADGIYVDETIDVVIDNDDGDAPEVTLDDLSQSDRTSDPVTGGHIEHDGDSLYDGTDPDVSGTITLKGHMHDNQRIRYFNMAIDNFDLGSGDGTEVALATWPQTYTGGTFGNLTISNVTLTESGGHDFDWTYVWNTANVTNRTGDNITVLVRAIDFTPNNSFESRDHDVVPYISGILRSLGAEATTRSKYGKYSVQTGETGLAINGYNLAKTGTYGTNSWVRVWDREIGDGATGTLEYDQIANADVTANGTFTQLTLTNLNAVTHSGWLRVMVNNIEAVNTVNSDLLVYNKEDDGSGIDETLWNDDRYLSVWRTGLSFDSSTNAQYPAMSIASDGTLYGSWTDYTTAASVFYGTTASATPIFQMYDPAEYSDIHLDSSDNISVVYLGNYYGGSGWSPDIDSAGAVSVYNTSAPQQVQRGGAYPWNYFYRFEMLYHDTMLLQFQRPKVVRTGNNIHIAYYDLNTNAVKYGYALNGSTSTGEMNWINIDGGSDGDDVIHLTGVGTRANTRVTDTALIGNTMIAAGQTIQLHNNLGNYGTALITAFTSGTGRVDFDTTIDTTYTSYTIITATSNLVSQGATRSTSAGSYVTIDVDEQGYPVIAYYDIAAQTIKLARATSTAPASPSDWYRQTVFVGTSDPNRFYIGQHVTIDFDTTGRLYLACYRISTGDLVYITAPDIDPSGPDFSNDNYVFAASTVIDSEGAVGAWADITLNGTTPYISYLNSSMIGTFNGLKVAYWDTTRSSWEYINAPLSTPISENRTSIEYAKGSVDWTVSVGYKGDAFDIVQLKPEE
ncbi:MAG: hypothetical protein JW904_09520 [Spirochaetales bacterium]|nr:hypothetical protein [Spirochaetales bacterium]